VFVKVVDLFYHQKNNRMRWQGTIKGIVFSITKKLKKGKIVMLTNLNNDNIIHDAFKYGADGYIIKSEVTPGGLIQEIEGVLK